MQQKKWPPAYQAVFVRGWVLKLTRKTWKRRLLRGVKWKDWLLWRRAGWIVYTAAMAPLLPLSLQIQHSSLSSLISCSPATIPKRISSGRSAAESNDIIRRRQLRVSIGCNRHKDVSFLACLQEKCRTPKKCGILENSGQNWQNA